MAMQSKKKTDMNDWFGFRLICLSVVIWLLKDYHGIGIEVTDIIDWLVIILICMWVVTL